MATHASALIEDLKSIGFNHQEAVSIVIAIGHARECPQFRVQFGTYTQDLLAKILG